MPSGLYSSLLTVFYPRECSVCNDSVEDHAAGVACAECWANTRIFSGQELLCGKCGAYLSESDTLVETLCRQCGEHQYDSARAVGIYEKALAASVINLKIVPFVSRDLQKRLVSAFNASPFHDSTLIVPVPLSKRRRFERGFNQAEVLGAIIANESGIRMDKLSLTRKLHTPMHRAAMDKKARESTVRNAFEVKRPKLIEGANVLLVDDVFTSGATSSYCAKILKKNGAGKVNVLTLARAV